MTPADVGAPSAGAAERPEATIWWEAPDGRRVALHRDVGHRHPAEVHEALGTSSEAELQMVLDGYRVEAYYDEDGRWLGPDRYGVAMACAAAPIA